MRNRLSHEDALALQQELVIMSSICPQHRVTPHFYEKITSLWLLFGFFN